ncbi:aminotransferase [Phaeosphaeriaceae sp. PMI808]|nr:aminotransferase [Phaeosphaeriaceae sp. PMI808]
MPAIKTDVIDTFASVSMKNHHTIFPSPSILHLLVFLRHTLYQLLARMSFKSSFPPPPKESIDWSKLGASAIEDNGHVECNYDAETGCWSEPLLIKDPYIKVHGLAPGLNYGMQAYEGMKAYRGPDNQINIFRPSYHASRFAISCAAVSIPAIPSATFLRAVNLVVARNAELVPPHASQALLYIRPVVFACDAHLMLTPPRHFRLAIYVAPANAYHGVSAQDALIMESFDRAAPRGTGHAKVGGNYAPVVRWSEDAKKRGFGMTLHLDSRTQSEIEEFSTSGFVGVRKEEGGSGYVLAVPDSENIVQSVTSDSIVTLAKAKGWKVEKRRIHFSELRYFTEVFAVGTAAALVPIKSITRESTGDKFVFNGGSTETGPCASELTAALTDMQKGKSSDDFGWRVRVEDIVEAEIPVQKQAKFNVMDMVDGCRPEESNVYRDLKVPSIEVGEVSA